MRPIRLLLSARDPAAAVAVTEIVRRINQDERFISAVVAGYPAADLLRSNGIDVDACELSPAQSIDSPNAQPLLAQADVYLARHEPDAVLVGLSGPDAGIDEALLFRACGRIPTYAVQDFWGDVNKTFGVAAETYFVLDGLASEITSRKANCRTLEVGSIKHDAYRFVDPVDERRRFRTEYGVGESDKALGYFGQPLDVEMVGRSLVPLQKCVLRKGPAGDGQWKIFCRRHPKESVGDFGKIMDGFRGLGLSVVDASNYPIEGMLSGCDLVVSCYSLSGFDQINLNRISPEPLGVTLFLMQDPEVLSGFQRYTGLSSMPLVEQSVSMCANSDAGFDAVLDAAASRDIRYELWKRIEAVVKPPGGSADRLLGFIADDFS